MDREFREQQELLNGAAQRTHQLSEVLYENGGASFLPVLTNETEYFSVELCDLACLIAALAARKRASCCSKSGRWLNARSIS
jgi:outer membrane protein TolC